MPKAASRCIRGGGRYPGVGSGVVPPAIVEIDAVISPAPDNHLTASPDCGVDIAAGGCVGGAGGCPTICARAVSPTGVGIIQERINSSPNDHFAAAPDCGVRFSADGRVNGAAGCPNIRSGIVSTAGIQIEVPGTVVVNATPDNHLGARPDCCGS